MENPGIRIQHEIDSVSQIMSELTGNGFLMARIDHTRIPAPPENTERGCDAVFIEAWYRYLLQSLRFTYSIRTNVLPELQKELRSGLLNKPEYQRETLHHTILFLEPYFDALSEHTLSLYTALIECDCTLHNQDTLTLFTMDEHQEIERLVTELSE